MIKGNMDQGCGLFNKGKFDHNKCDVSYNANQYLSSYVSVIKFFFKIIREGQRIDFSLKHIKT